MKKIIYLLFLFFSLFIVSDFAQNQQKIDALKDKLKKFELHKKQLGRKVTLLTDSSKANILDSIGRLYWKVKPDTAVFYAQQELFLSEKIGYRRGIGTAYNIFGVVNFFKGNTPGAIAYFQKALKIFEEIGYKVGTAMIYNNFGFMYQSLSNNNEAIKNFLIASELKKEMGDMKGVGVYYYAIGALYRVQGNYPQALKYEIAALKIQEKLGDKHDIAYAYDIIGTIYEQQENHPLALTYFTNSLKTYEEIVDKQSIVDKQGIAAEVNNIGVVYFDQHNYTEALKNELKASTMFKEIGDSGNLASNYLSIGDIYSQQGNYPEALKKYSEALKIKEKIGDKGGILESYKSLGRFYKKQGNLHEALKSESKAISLALEIDSKEQIKDVYGELAVIDAGLQNYKAAYDHEVLFKQYYDSIYNKENDKKLTSLQMQYDFDKKEQTDSIQHASENKINSLNLHKQKVLTGLGISGFILVILLLFFVYRNYTNQRKATAEMTIARQRAEQSEKFKEQFLANMSHEIRTPMNAVMGMTSLVMDSLLNEKQRFYLEGIMKSGETLLYIINDILDLSKIEAGKMEIENIDFSVSEVLEQVKQTLQHKAEEKGLQLIVDMDGKITDVRMGDPVRLNQVLMNLAGNAIKFTEKGSVAIEVKKGVSESGIRFSINDTGIGIPEDKLQTVFESFSQAKASDTRTYGGTGLGLTISKQLVELMDGKISVESKEGSGTTFSFEINFPFGSPERLKEQRSAEQIEGSILNGLKILLADDNEYNRIVTHDTLTSKANVEIKEVTNGKEAIDLLSQQDFDVVLMDVQMPLMDGYEATRFIREHFAFPKNQTPVIALTASVIRSDLDKCREAGMNDYIPKPFKASQLISVIAKVTQREIRFSVKSIPGVKNETENDKVTDLGYLKEFCEGDKERMQKYIVMFLASAPYIIDYINIALNNKDYPEIVSQMHGNKTKLVMMGMNKTKDLAAEIEMRCREGKSPDDLKEKVLTFVKQIQKAVTELKEV